MVEFLSLLLFLVFVGVSFYLKTKLDRTVEAKMETPLERGEVTFPPFAHTQDPDGKLHAELADLLALRPELETTFTQGGLTGGGNVVGAGERWRWAACRQKNIYAVPLTAALCRLCPDGLPDGEADFWQKGALDLFDESEGHFLLGLSYLRLYEPFHKNYAGVAQEAWRQAVVHFRRSAATGYLQGIDAALLMADIGHDLPFTPPAELPEPLPLCGEKEEVLYWRYRAAEAGSIGANILGVQYLQQPTPNMARAEYWLRQAMERGDYMAARILFDNYQNGNFPDETEKNAALCMIFFICQCGLLEFMRDITDEELENAEEELELDAHMRQLIATYKTEGRELHSRIIENVHAKYQDADKRLEQQCAQAREKLPALCRKAEERQQELLSAEAGNAASAPHVTPPQVNTGPRPAAPARGSAGPGNRKPASKAEPRRSFARPDKR